MAIAQYKLFNAQTDEFMLLDIGYNVSEVNFTDSDTVKKYYVYNFVQISKNVV